MPYPPYQSIIDALNREDLSMKLGYDPALYDVNGNLRTDTQEQQQSILQKPAEPSWWDKFWVGEKGLQYKKNVDSLLDNAPQLPVTSPVVLQNLKDQYKYGDKITPEQAAAGIAAGRLVKEGDNLYRTYLRMNPDGSSSRVRETIPIYTVTTDGDINPTKIDLQIPNAAPDYTTNIFYKTILGSMLPAADEKYFTAEARKETPESMKQKGYLEGVGKSVSNYNYLQGLLSPVINWGKNYLGTPEQARTGEPGSPYELGKMTGEMGTSIAEMIAMGGSAKGLASAPGLLGKLGTALTGEGALAKWGLGAYAMAPEAIKHLADVPKGTETMGSAAAKGLLDLSTGALMGRLGYGSQVAYREALQKVTPEMLKGTKFIVPPAIKEFGKYLVKDAVKQSLPLAGQTLGEMAIENQKGRGIGFKDMIQTLPENMAMNMGISLVMNALHAGGIGKAWEIGKYQRNARDIINYIADQKVHNSTATDADIFNEMVKAGKIRVPASGPERDAAFNAISDARAAFKDYTDLMSRGDNNVTAENPSIRIRVDDNLNPYYDVQPQMKDYLKVYTAPASSGDPSGAGSYEFKGTPEEYKIKLADELIRTAQESRDPEVRTFFRDMKTVVGETADVKGKPIVDWFNPNTPEKGIDTVMKMWMDISGLPEGLIKYIPPERIVKDITDFVKGNYIPYYQDPRPWDPDLMKAQERYSSGDAAPDPITEQFIKYKAMGETYSWLKSAANNFEQVAQVFNKPMSRSDIILNIAEALHLVKPLPDGTYNVPDVSKLPKKIVDMVSKNDINKTNAIIGQHFARKFGFEMSAGKQIENKSTVPEPTAPTITNEPAPVKGGEATYEPIVETKTTPTSNINEQPIQPTEVISPQNAVKAVKTSLKTVPAGLVPNAKVPEEYLKKVIKSIPETKIQEKAPPSTETPKKLSVKVEQKPEELQNIIKKSNVQYQKEHAEKTAANDMAAVHRAGEDISEPGMEESKNKPTTIIRDSSPNPDTIAKSIDEIHKAALPTAVKGEEVRAPQIDEEVKNKLIEQAHETPIKRYAASTIRKPADIPTEDWDKLSSIITKDRYIGQTVRKALSGDELIKAVIDKKIKGVDIISTKKGVELSTPTGTSIAGKIKDAIISRAPFIRGDILAKGEPVSFPSIEKDIQNARLLADYIERQKTSKTLPIKYEDHTSELGTRTVTVQAKKPIYDILKKAGDEYQEELNNIIELSNEALRKGNVNHENSPLTKEATEITIRLPRKQVLDKYAPHLEEYLKEFNDYVSGLGKTGKGSSINVDVLDNGRRFQFSAPGTSVNSLPDIGGHNEIMTAGGEVVKGKNLLQAFGRTGEVTKLMKALGIDKYSIKDNMFDTGNLPSYQGQMIADLIKRHGLDIGVKKTTEGIKITPPKGKTFGEAIDAADINPDIIKNLEMGTADKLKMNFTAYNKLIDMIKGRGEKPLEDVLKDFKKRSFAEADAEARAKKDDARVKKEMGLDRVQMRVPIGFISFMIGAVIKSQEDDESPGWVDFLANALMVGGIGEGLFHFRKVFMRRVAYYNKQVGLPTSIVRLQKDGMMPKSMYYDKKLSALIPRTPPDLLKADIQRSTYMQRIPAGERAKALEDLYAQLPMRAMLGSWLVTTPLEAADLQAYNEGPGLEIARAIMRGKKLGADFKFAVDTRLSDFHKSLTKGQHNAERMILTAANAELMMQIDDIRIKKADEMGDMTKKIRIANIKTPANIISEIEKASKLPSINKPLNSKQAEDLYNRAWDKFRSYQNKLSETHYVSEVVQELGVTPDKFQSYANELIRQRTDIKNKQAKIAWEVEQIRQGLEAKMSADPAWKNKDYRAKFINKATLGLRKQLQDLQNNDMAAVNKQLEWLTGLQKKITASRDNLYIDRWSWKRKGDPYGLAINEVTLAPKMVRGELRTDTKVHPSKSRAKAMFLYPSEAARDKGWEELKKKYNIVPTGDQEGMFMSDAFDRNGNKLPGRVRVQLNNKIDLRQDLAHLRTSKEQLVNEIYRFVKDRSKSKSLKFNSKLVNEVQDWLNNSGLKGTPEGDDMQSNLNSVYESLNRVSDRNDNTMMLRQLLDNTIIPNFRMERPNTNHYGWQPKSQGEWNQMFNFTHESKLSSASQRFIRGVYGQQLEDMIWDDFDKNMFDTFHEKLMRWREMLYGRPVGYDFIDNGILKIGKSEANIGNIFRNMTRLMAAKVLVFNHLAAAHNVAMSVPASTALGKAEGMEIIRHYPAALINSLAGITFPKSKIAYSYNPTMQDVFYKVLNSHLLEQSPASQYTSGRLMKKSTEDFVYIDQRAPETWNRAKTAMLGAYNFIKREPFDPKAMNYDAYIDNIAEKSILFSAMVEGWYDNVARTNIEQAIMKYPMLKPMTTMMKPFIQMTLVWKDVLGRAVIATDQMNGKTQKNARGLLSGILTAMFLFGVQTIPVIGDLYLMGRYLDMIVHKQKTDKITDGTATEEMWRHVRDMLVGMGFSRSDAAKAQDIFEYGLVSVWTGKNFSWNDTLGGYLSPFFISGFLPMLTNTAKIFGGDDTLGTKLLKTAQSFMPTSVQRLVLAAQQWNRGEYLDKNLNAMGKKFGFVDFVSYALFSRQLEDIKAQQSKFEDVNPIRTPQQQRQMMEQLMFAPGLKYSLPGTKYSKNDLKSAIMSDQNEAYKLGLDIFDAYKSKLDDPTVRQAKSHSLGMMTRMLADENLTRAIEAYARKDPAAFGDYLKGEGSYSQPEYQVQGTNDAVIETIAKLRRDVTDYYNSGVAGTVAGQYIASRAYALKGVRIAPNQLQIKFAWPDMPAAGGGKISTYAFNEQGYKFAMTRLMERFMSSNIGTATQLGLPETIRLRPPRPSIHRGTRRKNTMTIEHPGTLFNDNEGE